LGAVLGFRALAKQLFIFFQFPIKNNKNSFEKIKCCFRALAKAQNCQSVDERWGWDEKTSAKQTD